MPKPILALLALVCLSLGGCAGPSHLRPSDQQLIAGRTFVITGVSSGFGQGVAIKLAAQGANVVLAARRKELLDEVASKVRAAGGAALVVATDVSKPDDVLRLAEAARAQYGRIDVWINDAGVGAIGRFEDIPVEDEARLIDVNLKGVIYGSHAAMKQFRAQGFGSLVNVGSIESEVPIAYYAVYAASKAGVLALDQALNQEIRLSGNPAIRVATIMPWATDTPWWEHAANFSGHQARLPSMDDPQEVVDAIVWTAIHPTDKVPVGWKAESADSLHHVFPDLIERIAGNAIQEEQIEKAPPAAATSGTLFQPMQAGRAVRG